MVDGTAGRVVVGAVVLVAVVVVVGARVTAVGAPFEPLELEHDAPNTIVAATSAATVDERAPVSGRPRE